MLDQIDLYEEEMIAEYAEYKSVTAEDEWISLKSFKSMKFKELEDYWLYTQEEIYAC